MTSMLSESSLTDTKGRDRISSLLVAFRCVLRGLPLIFASCPGTPLRVLCIVAFDTVYSLRRSRRLPKQCIKNLALLLKFGASLNAAFDGKAFCPDEFRRLQQRLFDAGLRQTSNDYWRRIRQLELSRPLAVGDRSQCETIKAYREDVARLSLGFFTMVAFEYASVEDGIEATRTNSDLEILFRIVMQCQIIDDVFDYSKDVAQGLPGFLTASSELTDTFQLTSQAARHYANGSSISKDRPLFVLRITLTAVSVIAKTLIILGRWRQGVTCIQPIPGHVFGP
jgi:hypothetical protein